MDDGMRKHIDDAEVGTPASPGEQFLGHGFSEERAQVRVADGAEPELYELALRRLIRHINFGQAEAAISELPQLAAVLRLGLE